MTNRRAVVLALCTSPLAARGVVADPPGTTCAPKAAMIVPLPAPPRCPVTLPNGDSPPSERPSAEHHGNGKLCTLIGVGSFVRCTPDGPGDISADGSLAIK